MNYWWVKWMNKWDWMKGWMNCKTLQDSARLCNTLRYFATLCNTLQHSATLCEILRLNGNQAFLAIFRSIFFHGLTQFVINKFFTSMNFSEIPYFSIIIVRPMKDQGWKVNERSRVKGQCKSHMLWAIVRLPLWKDVIIFYLVNIDCTFLIDEVIEFVHLCKVGLS